MDPVLAKYARVAVPRYTSYPTVPHFQTAFPEAVYRSWLDALDLYTPVSLYVHVPFCRQLCWYCGCNMKLANRYEPVAAYVDTLLREIDLVRAALPGRLAVDHLHFGGGTPTALEPDDLARVMEALHQRFTILPHAELAIEGDPRTMTPEMAQRIGALGFTRASFGIQEFDPKVQAAINRIQPPDMVARAVGDLRENGVTAINFDLIYGLPHQTVPSLIKTVETCADLRPDRLALFGYAHVPWMAKKQRMIDEEALPGAMERSAQAEAAQSALIAAGYEAIGLDHFALPDDPLAQAAREGRLHRNFQGYTTDTAETLIPLGATSIGRTPHGFVQNLSETGAWTRAVEAGTLPVAKGHGLSVEDRLRAHVIERLMCDHAIDLAEAGRRFGASATWWFDARDELLNLAADGLITLDGARICVTDRGRPVVRVVAACFDTYRAAAQVRHSVAV